MAALNYILFFLLMLGRSRSSPGGYKAWKAPDLNGICLFGNIALIGVFLEQEMVSDPLIFFFVVVVIILFMLDSAPTESGIKLKVKYPYFTRIHLQK